MIEKYTILIHSDPEATRVSDVIQDGGTDRNDLVAMTESELLKYKDSSGESNLERIFSMYDNQEAEDAQLDYDTTIKKIDTEASISWDHPLKLNTHLVLPVDKLIKENIVLQGKNQVSDTRDLNIFVADKLRKLLTDPKYISFKKDVSLGTTRKDSPGISVYLWCRALSDNDEGELGGTILDISKYVMTTQTHVDESGGNFNITLPPLIASFTQDDKDDSLGKWTIDETTISRGARDYVSKSSLFKLDKGELVRNKFFFHTAVNKNDVIWIRMETLSSEVKDRNSSEAKLEDEIGNNELPNKTYDMIGLVDSSSKVTNPESNDVSISIQGRDLVKLIIDDGAYLLPLIYYQQNFLASKGDIIERNALTGAYDELTFARFTNIKDAMTFIINVVSNIEVVPDNLFSAYDNPSLKAGVVNKPDEKSISTLLVEEKNIRELIVVVRKQLNIASETSTEEENLIFNKVIVFTENWIETHNLDDGTKIFLSDYKDEFNGLIATENDPDITTVQGRNNALFKATGFINPQASIFVAALEYITFRDGIVPRDHIQPEAKGIWQIVELVIDKKVEKRTIADSSLSQPEGSLLGLFDKYCQKPWVEFYTDTYGDKFNFIVRQPIFDQAAIIEFIQSGLMDKLVISDADVVNESLSFSEEAYSWYEIKPQSVNMGSTTNLFNTIPIVVFDEIAKIYGSRKMVQVSNYISYTGRLSNKSNDDDDYVLRQVLLDLKFMIDTNQYLPFTRQGTIAIHGDRRFKRGTWMRYQPTGEIFYIDGVTNDYMQTNETVDRVTLLQVSRGMVEDYVVGTYSSGLANTDGTDIPLTYFNIVDTELIVELIASTLSTDGSEKTIPRVNSALKVREKLFNFFFKRKQFTSSANPFVSTVDTDAGPTIPDVFSQSEIKST